MIPVLMFAILVVLCAIAVLVMADVRDASMRRIGRRL